MSKKPEEKKPEDKTEEKKPKPSLWARFANSALVQSIGTALGESEFGD